VVLRSQLTIDFKSCITFSFFSFLPLL
jgi:hypothetical protein